MSFETIETGDKTTLLEKYGMAPQNAVWQKFKDRSVKDEEIMENIDDAWAYSGEHMAYAFLYKDAVDNGRPGLAKRIRDKYHRYYRGTDEGRLVETYR